MSSVCVGRFVVAASPDGETGWKLLQPQDVPEWLKNPDVLGQMREGYLAHNDNEPGSPFYCALEVAEPSAVEAMAGAKGKSQVIGAEGRRIILPEGHA